MSSASRGGHVRGIRSSHSNLAVELLGKGRYKEAVEHYRKALRLAPQLAGGRENLELGQRLSEQE